MDNLEKVLERTGTTEHLTGALRGPVLTFAVIALTATSISVRQLPLPVDDNAADEVTNFRSLCCIFDTHQ